MKLLTRRYKSHVLKHLSQRKPTGLSEYPFSNQKSLRKRFRTAGTDCNAAASLCSMTQGSRDFKNRKQPSPKMMETPPDIQNDSNSINMYHVYRVSSTDADLWSRGIYSPKRNETYVLKLRL